MVVDIQDRLLPAIEGAEACVAAARKIIEAGRLLETPIMVTEQYPAGLGRTCATLRVALGETPVFEKTRFSACVEPVVQRLAGLKRPHVIITGIEAHVCVQQTVLDLLELGYKPFLCADAVGSRRTFDRDIAIQRMRQAGAIITTVESAIFELTGEAGTERFKQILRIVK
jgi:hypothetical protein